MPFSGKLLSGICNLPERGPARNPGILELSMRRTMIKIATALTDRLQSVYANRVTFNSVAGLGSPSAATKVASVSSAAFVSPVVCLYGRPGGRSRKARRCRTGLPTPVRSATSLGSGVTEYKPSAEKYIMATQAQGASALAVFQFKSTEVRTVEKDGQVWFVASDIAKALHYRNADDMTRVLDEDEKGTHIVRTLSGDTAGRGGGDQTVTVINESGLYHALLKSRKPEAQPFRKWVTAEVLPAIRKTGRYIAPPPAPAITYKKISKAQLDTIGALVQARMALLPTQALRDKACTVIHRAIRTRFPVVDLRDLTENQLIEALLLAAQAPLEGEWLPYNCGAVVLTETEAFNLSALFGMLPAFKKVQQYAEQVLRAADSPRAAEMHDAWEEPLFTRSCLLDLVDRCHAVKTRKLATLNLQTGI